MGPRHLVTAVTMLVLVGILVVGGLVGAQQLFAPLPQDEEPAAEATPTCDPGPEKGERVRIKDVTVNVFNSGDRAGAAGSTMDRLGARGFRRGEIGNAPARARVRRVQVWVAEGEEDAGRLVAKNFGPKVKVVSPKSDDLADGIDVVVGERYPQQLGPRKSSVKVTAPQPTC